MAQAQSMDSWFGMNTTVRRLAAGGSPIFLTDSAVGMAEEENLHHLVANLEHEVDMGGICPFLTTKHSLEYCMWFAARAVDAGCGALSVLGGDKHAGPARCVPHGYLLRERISERYPELPLGGWANPHGDAARQAAYMADERYHAAFCLTQLVSHHDLDPMSRLMDAMGSRGVTVPLVAGVFYYRSARAKTLARLSQFFTVPVEGITADFAAGMSAAEVCARSIRELRRIGVTRVYVSNLVVDKAAEQLRAVRAAL